MAASANFLLAWQNLADLATLDSSSSIAEGLPLANLQTRLLSDGCRFLDPADAVIDVDLGAPRKIGFAGLFGHNGSEAAEQRLRCADSQAELDSDPTYDSAWGPVWPPFADVPSTQAAVTARWARLEMRDAGNPDGFLEIGRLWLADPWIGRRNYAYGTALGFDDPSGQEAARGAQVHVFEEEGARVLDVPLPWVSENEVFGVIARLQRLVGRRKDVVLLLSPDDQTWRLEKTIIGTIETMSLPVQVSHGLAAAGGPRWEVKLRIRESVV